MLNGGEVHVALPHSAFIIQHSALLFDFNIKHRRVIILAERLIGIVLPGFIVVLEEEERHLFERDGLALLAVTLDVGFGEAFHVHHFEHHSQVEVDVEQVLFPLDADNRCGVELKVFDFDFFHGNYFGYWLLAIGLFGSTARGQKPETRSNLLLQKSEKKTNLKDFARKLHPFAVNFIILSNH